MKRARLGSARLGSARLGSARLGSARLGSARLGSARLGSALNYIVGSFFRDERIQKHCHSVIAGAAAAARVQHSAKVMTSHLRCLRPITSTPFEITSPSDFKSNILEYIVVIWPSRRRLYVSRTGRDGPIASVGPRTDPTGQGRTPPDAGQRPGRGRPGRLPAGKEAPAAYGAGEPDRAHDMGVARPRSGVPRRLRAFAGVADGRTRRRDGAPRGCARHDKV